MSGSGYRQILGVSILAAAAYCILAEPVCLHFLYIAVLCITVDSSGSMLNLRSPADRILAAIKRLQQQGIPIQQKDIAAAAGMGVRTLLTCKGKDPLIANAINDAVATSPNEYDHRILRAIDSLMDNDGVWDQKSIAIEAGIAPKTVTTRKRLNPLVRLAIATAITATERRTDGRIIDACRCFGDQSEPVNRSAIAGEANISTALLQRRMRANSTVMDAVHPLLSLTADQRIMKAVAAHREHNTPAKSQKAIAMAAGVSESTLIAKARADPGLRQAIDSSLQTTDERILKAIVRLKAMPLGGCTTTQKTIALQAGLSESTITRRKRESVEVRTAVDGFLTAFSTPRRIIAAIEASAAQANVVTQKEVANIAGVSEATVAQHKADNPRVRAALKDVTVPPADERIIDALNLLRREGKSPTATAVAQLAGLDTSTVSHHKHDSPDLLALIDAYAGGPRKYPEKKDALDELARRMEQYGSEKCNTLSALRMPVDEGGDPGLVYACDCFGIQLPTVVRTGLNALVAYLRRINDTPILREAEARALWQQGTKKYNEATEELIVRVRPMTKIIIETELHEEIDPYGFKADLVEHLISEGDYVIRRVLARDILLGTGTTEVEAWNGRESLLGYFHRTLCHALRHARKYFYVNRDKEKWMPSIDTPLCSNGGAATVTLGSRLPDQTTACRPDTAAQIIDGSVIDNTEQIIHRRDMSSGVPFILGPDKQVLAATLKTVFASDDLMTPFQTGLQNSWAMYTTGSLGRLGTAVIGNVDWNALILTDLDDIFLERALASIANRLAGRLVQGTDSLPTVVIGRGDDYDRVIEIANGDNPNARVLERFVRALRRFGVGTDPSKGIATIEAVTIDQINAISAHPADTNSDRSAVRALAHIADEEMAFQAGRNGILVTESSTGAGRRLTKALTAQVRTRYEISTYTKMLVHLETRFLEQQRLHIEQASK
jgi:transcription initiation factor TFIIIB Brf1 subunit/transcription initiation factor TFIIB